MSKSKKNAAADKSEIVKRLEDADFTASESGRNLSYERGQHRVEVSYSPDKENGGATEHIKFYIPGNDKPVFHTNAGTMPSDEFWKSFLGQ